MTIIPIDLSCTARDKRLWQGSVSGAWKECKTHGFRKRVLNACSAGSKNRSQPLRPPGEEREMLWSLVVKPKDCVRGVGWVLVCSLQAFGMQFCNIWGGGLSPSNLTSTTWTTSWIKIGRGFYEEAEFGFGICVMFCHSNLNRHISAFEKHKVLSSTSVFWGNSVMFSELKSLKTSNSCGCRSFVSNPAPPRTQKKKRCLRRAC